MEIFAQDADDKRLNNCRCIMHQKQRLTIKHDREDWINAAAGIATDR